MKIFENTDQEQQVENDTFLTKKMQRRNFLTYAGAGAAGIALVAAGCKKDNNQNYRGIDLGTGDIGILNYAYALEQLEAAFYIKVASSFYTGISAEEIALFTDIRDHEIAHREFFKTVLGNSAIPALEVDFSSIDFTNRTSVLATSKAFEDLGVSAYNGAGYLIKDAGYLTFAGKIVSVEARHAAYIRNLITPGDFAGTDVVDANGLDKSRSPIEVLNIAKTYIKTEINASNLPS
jgi:hypothetical protein|nr:ferritin-like domain-containing protein [uncultured Pedobacter sp.]